MLSVGSDGNKKLKTSSVRDDNELRTTYDYAMYYHSNGLCVIPIKPHSKEPLVEWKRFQDETPSMQEIREWFTNTENNVAIVCGKVSGNLVVIDFDDEDVFREFVRALDDELKEVINDTWIVRTSRGFHVYLKVGTEKQIFSSRFDRVDIKAEHSYVVAPPSVHPSGIRYEFLSPDMPWTHVIRIITPEQFEKIKSVIANVVVSKHNSEVGEPKPEPVNETPKPVEGHENEDGSAVSITRGEVGKRTWRELTNSQMLKITKALEPVYKPGLRHDIVLYLVGWLYKANVKYESAEKLVKTICETYKDEECEDRLYTLKDTYGIGRQPREEVLKSEGKSLSTKGGLFAVLSQHVDEETAMTVVKNLEEILEAPEPDPSILIERLNYDKEIYAVLNFKRCEILTAQRIRENDDEKLVFKDRVILGCPEKVTVIAPPYSQISRFDIVWTIPFQKRKLTLEGVTVDEVLAYLKANGLVLNKNVAENVLNAVINAMIRKGLAEVRTGFEAPGFYWADGQLIANKVEVRKPTPEELREALKLLNELVSDWFAKVKEQFVTALKLGLLMPFSFAVKQKFKGEKGFLPWLYIYGERDTGKSTTGEIILHVFGIADNRHVMGHGAVDTEAKMGAVLAVDTFPKLVNEGEALFDKPNLVELIKHSVEGIIARQRFETKSTIREYPALSSLIITANHMRLNDPALVQKRLVVLRYPISARQPPERINEFRTKVSPRLPKLRALGQFVISYLIEHPDELTYDWLSLSERLLEKAYEHAGIKPSFDLNAQYVHDEEMDSRLEIVLILWGKLQEAFIRKLDLRDENGGRIVPKEPYEVLEAVLESRAVDFAIRYGDEVLFTAKVVQILQSEGAEVDSMRALAERFADYGFQYDVRKIAGKTTRVLAVKFKDLVRLFAESFNPNEPRGVKLTDYSEKNRTNHEG